METTGRFDFRRKRRMREKWAKKFNKSCLWCGVKSHTEKGYCQHPFCQTWDKEHSDCQHFEEWLTSQPVRQSKKIKV